MSMHIIKATLVDGSKFWVQQLPDGDFCYRKDKRNATPYEAKHVENILMSLQFAYPNFSFAVFDALVSFTLNADTRALVEEATR
jgi:hypothetical protein